jgi:regulatory protein
MPRAPLSLRGRALGYLARREHSRAELATKLRRFLQPEEDLEALLDDFEQRGWLSEARLVQAVLDAPARRGAARVLHDLRRRGVEPALIEAARRPLLDGELDAARSLWGRRFGRPALDAADRARQIRFLRYRGFAPTTIERVLREAGDAARLDPAPDDEPA